jgi:hypothetical protein
VRVVFLPDVGLARKDATDLCLRDAEKVCGVCRACVTHVSPCVTPVSP